MYTVEHVAAVVEALGLKPAQENGSWAVSMEFHWR